MLYVLTFVCLFVLVCNTAILVGIFQREGDTFLVLEKPGMFNSQVSVSLIQHHFSLSTKYTEPIFNFHLMQHFCCFSVATSIIQATCRYFFMLEEQLHISALPCTFIPTMQLPCYQYGFNKPLLQCGWLLCSLQ